MRKFTLVQKITLLSCAIFYFGLFVHDIAYYGMPILGGIIASLAIVTAPVIILLFFVNLIGLIKPSGRTKFSLLILVFNGVAALMPAGLLFLLAIGFGSPS